MTRRALTCEWSQPVEVKARAGQALTIHEARAVVPGGRVPQSLAALIG